MYNERQALSVSGACSAFDGQRSYNYENTSAHLSYDLGLSTSTASSVGFAKPVKNAKNYLKDIEGKFNNAPDPRADLQLLNRYKNTTNNFKVERDMKEDEVPQIFRKMHPTSQEQQQQQNNPVLVNANRQFQHPRSMAGSQHSHLQQPSQPFKIVNYQNEQQRNADLDIQKEQQKGFFERIFSFGSDKRNSQQQQANNMRLGAAGGGNQGQQSRRVHEDLNSINDVEAKLIQVRDDMNRRLSGNYLSNGMHRQFEFVLDFTERVLREQQQGMLGELLRLINEQLNHASVVLHAHEFAEFETVLNEVKSLTQHKILHLRVANSSPEDEQRLQSMNQFYAVASNYILNTKGYSLSKAQLDKLYSEVQILKVPQSQWQDFISKRI